MPIKCPKTFSKLCTLFTKKNTRKRSIWHAPKTAAYFKPRKKRIQVSTKGIWTCLAFVQWKYFLLSIVIFILVMLGIMIWGPFFKIQHINIIKRDNISNIEISYSSVQSLRDKNIFWVWFEDIRKKMLSYQPNLASIQPSVSFPNTLKITIESYPGLFNTLLWNKNYIITQNGVLVPKNPHPELQNISVFLDEWTSFLEYRQIFQQEYIEKIYTLVEWVTDNIIWSQVFDMLYYQNEREAHIILKSGVRLIFDLNTDSTEQIEKIAVFHKESQNILSWELTYIDLRIKNRIFYCPTTVQYQCLENLKSIYE